MGWFHHNPRIEVYRSFMEDRPNMLTDPRTRLTQDREDAIVDALRRQSHYFLVNRQHIQEILWNALKPYKELPELPDEARKNQTLLKAMDDLAKEMDAYFCTIDDVATRRWIELVVKGSRGSILNNNRLIPEFRKQPTIKEKFEHLQHEFIIKNFIDFSPPVNPTTKDFAYSIHQEMRAVASITDAFFISIGLGKEWVKLIKLEQD